MKTTEPKPKTPDGRNLVDFYAYWSNEAIKANLDTKRFNYSILCHNVVGDFNLSCVVRSSNAFLAKEVIIYGKKKFDKRGTVGTHNYMDLKHVRLEDNLDELFKKYDLVVAVENVPEAEDIAKIQWDPNQKILFCFGEEGAGLSKEFISKCHKCVYIKQFGSVRSLNIAVASSVVMFHYTSQFSQQMTH